MLTDGFLEHPVLYLPGTELVADSDLSYGDDLYLADHEIQGGGVLPAVLALESFAQAAGMLGLAAWWGGLEQVSLTSPVDVGRDDSGHGAGGGTALRPGTGGAAPAGSV